MRSKIKVNLFLVFFIVVKIWFEKVDLLDLQLITASIDIISITHQKAHYLIYLRYCGHDKQ